MKNSYRYRWAILTCFVILLGWVGCQDDDMLINQMPAEDRDLTMIPFAPDSFNLVIPEGFPKMEHPEDNPQTQQGVLLGRMLFFDPILSLDSTVSCATCHKPELSFTDGLAFSVGVGGRTGRRSSMSLLNVGFHGPVGLFWDGRAKTLEEQALEPIVDPNEMANTWEEVELRLRRHAEYPDHVRTAFGIQRSSQVTRDHVVKALAQFQRTLVSSGDSDWDRKDRNEFSLDDDAATGEELFFDDIFPDAECGHCHNVKLFTIPEFRNNGLDPVDSVDDYSDKGLGGVTGNRLDNGKFKIPSLRNILLTAPYMHDGRFETIEEVMEHYNSGGHHVTNQDEDNVDNLIRPLNLSERNKREIIAFLGALTDSTFIKNESFQSPF